MQSQASSQEDSESPLKQKMQKIQYFSSKIKAVQQAGPAEDMDFAILKLDKANIESLTEAPEYREDHSSMGGPSSASDSEESGSPSILSDLSLMFGEDNKSNSSDNVSSNSDVQKDIKYKIIARDKSVALEKETLQNLKIKQ